MCNYPPNINELGLKSSDYIALTAIVVSLITLLYSIRNTYKTKRIEIQYSEFEKICIKNIDKILSGLDKLFDEQELQKADDYRKQITAVSVELQCFVVSLKKSVYHKIDVQHFVDIIETFTDSIYNSNGSTLLEFKGEYYTTKLLIYNSLYLHAIQKEFQIRYAPRSTFYPNLKKRMRQLVIELFISTKSFLLRYLRYLKFWS